MGPQGLPMKLQQQGQENPSREKAARLPMLDQKENTVLYKATRG